MYRLAWVCAATAPRAYVVLWWARCNKRLLLAQADTAKLADTIVTTSMIESWSVQGAVRASPKD